jgi:hypothetical protein
MEGRESRAFQEATMMGSRTVMVGLAVFLIGGCTSNSTSVAPGDHADGTPGPGAPGESQTESFSRIDVYLPLIDDIAGDHGDTLFVQSDICRRAGAAVNGEGPPCDDRFAGTEQAEIAQALPDWKQVRFVRRYEDIPDDRQPINHEGNVYVWVGALDEHADHTYWVGAGMSCGGLCGGGGTFVMRLENGSWVNQGHAPGTGVWIS